MEGEAVVFRRGYFDNTGQSTAYSSFTLWYDHKHKATMTLIFGQYSIRKNIYSKK